ncbi:hypothetical protein GCM10019059_39850 [Camelimonas fluminis]|nr:hypothetical protein GCM10019059_39850 [Camelimonas fluminis]
MGYRQNAASPSRSVRHTPPNPRRGTLAAFGQLLICNPDLVERLRDHWPLTTSVRETYYGCSAQGYVYYPPYRAA